MAFPDDSPDPPRDGAATVRNVRFVLQSDFASNSATHVHALANALCAAGCDCQVLIDGDVASAATLSAARYRIATYADALAGHAAAAFADGRPPDIVHAWTPRERVRKFCLALGCANGSRPPHLIVHLEDNEEQLLEASFKKKMRHLRALDRATLDAIVPPHLCDPHRYRDFLRAADGATVLIDRLEEFLPPDAPRCVFWPAADEALFHPRPANLSLRKQLGIQENDAVFVYTGNVHESNAREVRSLYLAVALLNRAGRPTKLVRAGSDWTTFLGEDTQWARDFTIALGPQPHHRVPELLALADVLVQPGRPDPFNDYRFPSKLPEFFAMGKPIILPASNVGLRVEHGRHAWVLPQADATSIADAATHLLDDAPLRLQLAVGALEFADEHFSWKKNADTVLAFYRRLARSTQ